MKKFTLLIMMMLLGIVGVKAGEYVVYQPDAPVSISYNSEAYAGSSFDTYTNSVTFPILGEGDIIKIHTTNVGSSPVYQLIYKAGDGWTWTDLTVNSSVDGIISYTVESNEIATLIKDRGIVISGIYYKILDITVETNNLNFSLSLISGVSKDLGNWNWDGQSLRALSDSEVKVGDIMNIAYTTYSEIASGEWATIHLQSSTTHKKITDACAQGFQETNTSKILSITIDNAILSELKAGTAIIRGGNVYLNSVTIFSQKTIITLSDNTIYFGNWTNSYALNSSDLNGISVNDVLKISYSVPGNYADGSVFLRSYYDDKWNTINGYNDQTSLSGDGTVEFTINQDLLDLVNDGKTISVLGSGASNTADNTGVSGTGCAIIHYTTYTQAGYRPVYIPAGGYATFYGTSTCALPDGVNAYYVSETSETSATLAELSNIPANNGVILKGTTGIYQLYTTTAEAASVSGNMLVGSASRTQIAETSNKYVLYDNSGTPEFRNIIANTYLDAYKCYLYTGSASNSPARLGIIFDNDETTGISNMLMTGEKMNHVYYNLAGQLVTQPAKGLYIVNGKKVVIK